MKITLEVGESATKYLFHFSSSVFLTRVEMSSFLKLKEVKKKY